MPRVPTGELAYSAEEWTEILEGGNKTIVLMGGPHRGGTTLLWSIVREHPDISHFGDQKQSGIDHSEGEYCKPPPPRAFLPSLVRRCPFARRDLSRMCSGMSQRSVSMPWPDTWVHICVTGMFAQSVFPRFGIGTEYSQMMHKSKEDLQFGRKKGLGGYALADELEVHWTEGTA